MPATGTCEEQPVRTTYEIAGTDGSVAARLVATAGHPEHDPDEIFVRAVRSSYPGFAVAHLLSVRYESDHGDHRVNDRIFDLRLAAGPETKVVRAVYDEDGNCTVREIAWAGSR
jgi:hypothetical protein